MICGDVYSTFPTASDDCPRPWNRPAEAQRWTALLRSPPNEGSEVWALAWPKHPAAPAPSAAAPAPAAPAAPVPKSRPEPDGFFGVPVAAFSGGDRALLKPKVGSWDGRLEAATLVRPRSRPAAEEASARTPRAA